VPAHIYHEALAGYDERQILHDGCQECEYRGKHLDSALYHMDSSTFRRAWQRAYDLHSADGKHENVGQVSNCERELLDVFWGIRVRLEKL